MPLSPSPSAPRVLGREPRPPACGPGAGARRGSGATGCGAGEEACTDCRVCWARSSLATGLADRRATGDGVMRPLRGAGDCAGAADLGVGGSPRTCDAAPSAERRPSTNAAGTLPHCPDAVATSTMPSLRAAMTRTLSPSSTANDPSGAVWGAIMAPSEPSASVSAPFATKLPAVAREREGDQSETGELAAVGQPHTLSLTTTQTGHARHTTALRLGRRHQCSSGRATPLAFAPSLPRFLGRERLHPRSGTPALRGRPA